MVRLVPMSNNNNMNSNCRRIGKGSSKFNVYHPIEFTGQSVIESAVYKIVSMHVHLIID